MTAPLHWQVAAANPVIVPGRLHPGLDDQHAGAGHVLDLGDRYRLYYWGRGRLGNVILMAEAPVSAPNAWRPVGEALLAPQPDTDYNAGGPSFPFVLPVDERHWLLYFCGWGRATPERRLANCTGLALSDDAGLTWRYQGTTPLLAFERPYERAATGSVSVVRMGAEFRLYYTAIGHYYPRPPGVRTGHGDTIPRIGIAYATSPDGITWTKPFDEWLVAPRGFTADPYEYINSKPFVCRDGAGWRMWISTFGHAYRVRSLVSADGLTWARVPSGPDGDLGVGAPGAFDSEQRCYAAAVPHAGGWRLWFTGNGFGHTGMGFAEA